MSGNSRAFLLTLFVSALIHWAAISWVMPPQPEDLLVEELSILIAMAAPSPAFEEREPIESEAIVEEVSEDAMAPTAADAKPESEQKDEQDDPDEDPVDELTMDISLDDFEPRHLLPDRPLPTETLLAPEAMEPNPRAESDYETVIAAWLDRCKRYPRHALRRGVEGDCVLRIVIDRSGTVRMSRIESSSGSLVLDREALAMVERANPFPPAPLDLPGETLEYMIPVIFDIE